MSKDIYQPPKSNLSKRKINKLKREKFDGSFDKVMKASFCWAAFIEIFFTFIPLVDPDEDFIAGLIVGLLLNLILTLFIVYLVRVIRGNIVVSKKNPEFERYLGIGGYIWRILVIRFFSILLFVPIIFFTGVLNHLERPSLMLTIASTILLIPTSVISTWLIFSQNRKEQFQWIISLFRGY